MAAGLPPMISTICRCNMYNLVLKHMIQIVVQTWSVHVGRIPGCHGSPVGLITLSAVGLIALSSCSSPDPSSTPGWPYCLKQLQQPRRHSTAAAAAQQQKSRNLETEIQKFRNIIQTKTTKSGNLIQIKPRSWTSRPRSWKSLEDLGRILKTS